MYNNTHLRGLKDPLFLYKNIQTLAYVIFLSYLCARFLSKQINKTHHTYEKILLSLGDVAAGMQ